VNQRKSLLATIAFWLALVTLFEMANRGAYQGFFHDDDLDNAANGVQTGAGYYLNRLLSPQFEEWNFRPAAHFYYHVMARAADLHFPAYIAAIHAMHLLAVFLLWGFLRRLHFSRFAACSGALFFAFHMAAFDVYWRPMYVFDLMAGLFVIACLLAYASGWTVLSALLFWLAYKSKEVVIFLPLFLALYEAWFAQRRWIRLLPFFLISANFGIQALLINRAHTESDYTLRFTPQALWICLRYYAPQWLQSPIGWALLLLPVFRFRDRRLLFGMAGLMILMGPLLFLPGRLYGAYLYTGLAALAVSVAALADQRWGRPAVVLFFAIWLPWNYAILQEKRKEWLAESSVRRLWLESLREPLKALDPRMKIFVRADDLPLELHGMAGGIRLLRPGELFEYKFYGEAKGQLQAGTFAIVGWDPASRRATLGFEFHE
jgi:hypothetical protein